jgi:hypothetical protein
MDSFFGLDRAHMKDESLELLTTVSDRASLMIIESILRDAKIPYITKDRGCGTVVKVITGFSSFGTDIFVLREHLEDASALISPCDQEDVTTEIDEEEEA